MKFSKICVVTILCMCLMVGAVSADNNTTVLGEEQEFTLPPIMIESGDYPMYFESIDEIPDEYKDYQNWYATTTDSPYYDRYMNEEPSPIVTRQQVAALLLDESKSEDQRHREEYVLMGLNDKLQRFMDAKKISVDGVWYIGYDYEPSFLDNLFSVFSGGYNYEDYYEGKFAVKQYDANMVNWLGVKSRHLLHLEGY